VWTRGRTTLAAGVVAVLVLAGHFLVQASEVAGTPVPVSGGGTPGVLPPLTAPYDKVLGFHGSGMVAYLTFDDGPSRYTAQVLDILAAAGVKATFCQIGSQINGFPDVERRLIADGHTLCNHSWTHPDSIAALSATQIDQQIGNTQKAFAQFGVTVHYFRAPDGDFGKTTTTLRQLCQQYQTRPLGWAVDSEDWKKPGVTKIVQTALSSVSPGAIILLHDGGGTDRDQTMAAIPGIISGLQGQGYTLTALPSDGPD
jgi:peptidoglycan/xylan/chitin deacetylase (PgdA/CDA1 family)